MQPLEGPLSVEPLWEQEEQEDLRVLGCQVEGKPLPGPSIRSWGAERSRTRWSSLELGIERKGKQQLIPRVQKQSAGSLTGCTKPTT